jgi:hypothetical protein
MPGKKSVGRHLQKVNSIRAALKADGLGKVDSEDRSALDFLIIDLQSLPSGRPKPHRGTTSESADAQFCSSGSSAAACAIARLC